MTKPVKINKFIIRKNAFKVNTMFLFLSILQLLVEKWIKNKFTNANAIKTKKIIVVSKFKTVFIFFSSNYL